MQQNRPISQICIIQSIITLQKFQPSINILKHMITLDEGDLAQTIYPIHTEADRTRHG